MQLNSFGTIVAETYQWLSERYPYVCLDEWIIMPNHFHGIIVLTDTPCRGAVLVSIPLRPTSDGAYAPASQRDFASIEAVGLTASRSAPTHITDRKLKRKSLGSLIGAFETVSTKKINLIRNAPGTPAWQRNYYEHIIRNEESLDRIRQYIIDNSLSWQIDQLHPNNPSKW